MSSRRLLKAAEAIREVVGMAILAELKDPRIRDVTVTHVDVSPDMRHAKVHVSIMGDEARQKLSLRGLQSAAGFLQAKIAEQIDTRYTPRLTFVLDQGVKKSIEIAQLLKEVLPGGSTAESNSASNLFSTEERVFEANSSEEAENTSGDRNNQDQERERRGRTRHPR